MTERRLIDVDITDRGDGKAPVWDTGTGTHVYVAATGAEFATGSDSVATGETTTSTTYADLSTVGPSVTVTVGASGKVMLHMRCRLQNNTAGQFSAVGVVISGATTVAAQTIMLVDTANAAYLYEFGASKVISGLNPGSTTFKMQYIVEGGTGTFTNRELTIAPVL